MSPGSVSQRSSSLLTAVEDVSARRAKLWGDELERRVRDVDRIVAARQQRRRMTQELSSASSNASEEEAGPKPVKVVARKSAFSALKSEGLLNSSFEKLMQLQVELLATFHALESKFGQPSSLHLCEKSPVSMNALKEVTSVCRSELKSVRSDCFKASLPAAVVEQVVKVHGTINTAVKTFLADVQQHFLLAEQKGRNAFESVEDLLDTICLLCGVVGNLRRHGGQLVPRMKEPVHLDLLDWIVTNRLKLMDFLALVGSAQSALNLGQKVRVEAIQERKQDSRVADEGSKSAGIVREEGDRQRMVPHPLRKEGGVAKTAAASPESAMKDKEYWKVVEQAAGQLIDDIMGNVDAFISKAEEDAIRKVLDEELRG